MFLCTCACVIYLSIYCTHACISSIYLCQFLFTLNGIRAFKLIRFTSKWGSFSYIHIYSLILLPNNKIHFKFYPMVNISQQYCLQTTKKMNEKRRNIEVELKRVKTDGSSTIEMLRKQRFTIHKWKCKQLCVHCII